MAMVLPRMTMDRRWMCALCVLACLSVHFVKGGEDMTGCNVDANLETDPVSFPRTLIESIV